MTWYTYKVGGRGNRISYTHTVKSELRCVPRPQEFRVDSLECFMLNLVRVVNGGTVIGAEILNGVKMYLGKYLLNLG